MKTALFVVLCAGLASATTVVQSQAHEQKAFFKDVPGPSGLDEKNLRIFNGGVATRSQFPFQAAVYLNFASFCGGSLIHPKWVLTAAHCVSGFRKWAVFLGMDNILKAKQEGRITLITNWGVYHEDYDSSSITNDIGVLQLPREVQLTEHIQLSKLAPADVNYAGRTARVSGFGRVADDGAGQVSPVLKYADLTVASNKVCYDFYSESHVSQICLTAEGTSSCKGDSGGPLTLKDDSGSVIQIGLTSFGCRRGCTFGCPVGFTRINLFYDWLSEKTGINFPI